ncbi:MAG: ABC transporter substrate-binding protein [Actinomycetota bacterium]
MTTSASDEGASSRQLDAQLRLGLYAPGCLPGYHLPYYAAADGGEFTRRGLDVELSDPEGGLDTLRALGQGRLDACITSVAHYLRALQEDGSVAARFALMIARRTHLAAFVVDTGDILAGSPTSLADLDGARLLGDERSSFTREYLTVMRAAGVSPAEIVGAPHGHDLRMLLRGDGDVIVEFLEMLPRFASVARRQGVAIRALPFFEVTPDVYGSGLLISDRLLDESPDVAALLISALRDAVFATRDNPRARVPALRERLRGVTEDRAIAAWRLSEQLIFDENGAMGPMTESGWNSTRAHFERVNGGSTPAIRMLSADEFV